MFSYLAHLKLLEEKKEELFCRKKNTKLFRDQFFDSESMLILKTNS